MVVVTTYALVNPVDDTFIAFFRDTLAPRAQADGAELRATFVSEESANNFPPLPVRLYHDLRQAGIYLKNCPLTDEELVEELWQLRSKT